MGRLDDLIGALQRLKKDICHHSCWFCFQRYSLTLSVFVQMLSTEKWIQKGDGGWKSMFKNKVTASAVLMYLLCSQITDPKVNIQKLSHPGWQVKSSAVEKMVKIQHFPQSCNHLTASNSLFSSICCSCDIAQYHRTPEFAKSFYWSCSWKTIWRSS